MPDQHPTALATGRRTVFGLICGAMMISFSGVWVKVSHVTPTASAFYRVLFGGFFLLLGSLWRKEFRLLTWRQTALVVLCGIFFALDLVAYHYSVHYIGPGLGTILPNFQVFIMAAVGVLFLKERLGAAYLWSIPLAVAGLFLVVGIQWDLLGAQYKLGVYLGLAASACYVGFLLSLRRLQANKHKVSFFYILMLVSWVTAGFIALEVVRTHDTFAIPDLQSLFSLTALGLFSQAVGWMLIANALPQLRISLSGLILLLQPALAFIWDVLLFDRPTSGLNWIGVIVVLGAIYAGSLGAKRGGE
ncbi:MAG: DMT family transporter [Desulfobacteraceae bacterium]|jgi:drug/metabolite transporter (DMT)-like permease